MIRPHPIAPAPLSVFPRMFASEDRRLNSQKLEKEQDSYKGGTDRIGATHLEKRWTKMAMSRARAETCSCLDEAPSHHWPCTPALLLQALVPVWHANCAKGPYPF